MACILLMCNVCFAPPPKCPGKMMQHFSQETIWMQLYEIADAERQTQDRITRHWDTMTRKHKSKKNTQNITWLTAWTYTWNTENMLKPKTRRQKSKVAYKMTCQCKYTKTWNAKNKWKRQWKKQWKNKQTNSRLQVKNNMNKIHENSYPSHQTNAATWKTQVERNQQHENILVAKQELPKIWRKHYFRREIVMPAKL